MPERRRIQSPPGSVSPDGRAPVPDLRPVSRRRIDGAGSKVCGATIPPQVRVAFENGNPALYCTSKPRHGGRHKIRTVFGEVYAWR